ncbi:floral homeotic protein AGAMOUS-like [Impatiens glandulifera]|uniref:floral homeotic protein AGAMOUS-like n=1 Tax=Impatiens glandulifera TaxID=253017 RepID=UPI001FB08931|nr:floral homeotic protein AGAMOUS-like [Impatiens glandulifera]
MELIKNRKSRQISFKRMKENLMKKASELHTLCDVDVSIITFPPNTDGEDDEKLQPEIWPAEGSNKFLSQIEEFKKQSQEEKMKRTVEVDSYLEERCKKLEDEIIKQRKKNYDAVYPSWNHPYYNDLPEEKLFQIASDLEYKLHQSTNVFKLGSQQDDYHHHPSEFIPNITSNFHNNIVDNQYLLLDQQQPDNLYDNLIYDYDYYASTIPPKLMNIGGDDEFRTIDINNNMIHMRQNGYEEQQIGYYSGMMQNNNNTMQYQSPMDTTGSMMHYQYVPPSLSSSTSSSSSSIFNSGYSDTCGESQLLHPPPLLLPQNRMDVNWNQYYCV